MALPRFFHASLPTVGPVVLEPSEGRHASNVLRLEPGAEVVLFDGMGGEALCSVAEINKHRVTVEIACRTDSNRELDRPLEMWVALPKGDRQKTLIEGLVQLGVTRLVPLMTVRGVAQPSSGALDRLGRAVVETSKQCGRNRLLEIAEPRTVNQAAATPLASDHCGSVVAHPYGSPWPLSELVASGGKALTALRVAIGPEGGFTEEEISIWEGRGWRTISLGPRILRIEMAALQVAAWWATLPVATP